jgi:hypothetical protein
LGRSHVSGDAAAIAPGEWVADQRLVACRLPSDIEWQGMSQSARGRVADIGEAGAARRGSVEVHLIIA